MVEIHLHVRVLPDGRAPFLEFLREAIPFYERPGGISITLLQDEGDANAFIERVRYDSEAAYARDQQRVADDREMRAFLDRWRGLLAEPPVVKTYRRVPVNPQGDSTRSVRA